LEEKKNPRLNLITGHPEQEYQTFGRKKNPPRLKKKITGHPEPE
jgi:hypothetical protein